MRRIKFTEAQMEQAYVNWVDFHYGWDCEEAVTRFFTWIDPGKMDREAIDPFTGRGHCKVLPRTASRINALLSPHHYAYLKAWYIQHPWK